MFFIHALLSFLLSLSTHSQPAPHTATLHPMDTIGGGFASAPAATPAPGDTIGGGF